MRRLVTLLLLVLLGYNSIGYYFYFLLQQNLAQKEISNYINSGSYLEEELTLFKVPLNSYYEQSAKDFNRVEGDFEYNGKFYERVKERVENDTIYIYCINDEKQEQLYNQLANHVNDNILSGKSASNKSTKIFKDLIKEYLRKTPQLPVKEMYLLSLVEYEVNRNVFLQNFYNKIPTPPPELS